MFVCVCVCTRMYVFMHVYVYMYVCMYTCLYVCTRMYVCMYVQQPPVTAHIAVQFAAPYRKTFTNKSQIEGGILSFSLTWRC